MVYKRYAEHTAPGDRLRLRSYKGFWWALGIGVVSAVVVGLVLTQALRPSAVGTEPSPRIAEAAPTPEPTVPPPTAAPLAAPATLAPRPAATLITRSPTPAVAPSPLPPGQYGNADLERVRRGAATPPLLPASPSPRTAGTSPRAPLPPSGAPGQKPVMTAGSASPPASPRPVRSAPAVRQGEAAPEPSADAGAQGDEAFWRGRTQRRLAAVRAAEGRLRQAQDRVSALREQTTAALSEGSDRAPDLQAQLQQAEDRLNQADKDLQRAEQSLDGLEDEARRAGVPLAWVSRPQR